MGMVIDTETGELTQMQTVVHVDTFIQSLTDVVPSVASMPQVIQTITLTGTILQTQLVFLNSFFWYLN